MLDICLLYTISKSECYATISRCIKAINNIMVVEFPLNDVQKLEELAAGFEALSPGGVWKKNVGAVDGCVFKQTCPGTAVSNPARYSARLHLFSFIL